MINLTPYVKTLDNKPVAVFGLGSSGLSTVKALVRAGADVLAWDDNGGARDRAADLGARVNALDRTTLSRCACLVLSPGVPYTHNPHSVVQAAQAVKCEIITDIELLHRTGHARRVVGITGTNGKSTTTAIIDHVLRANGMPVACGGNIGRPVMDLDMPPEEGVFVLELSSYQLDLCPGFRPDIAVLLNITPDHLDRHGTMAAYVEAKAKILDSGEGTVIVGAQAMDFEPVRASLPVSRPMIHPHGTASPGNLFLTAQKKHGDITAQGFVWTEGRIIYSGDHAVADLSGFLSLPGDHNMQNAAAAYAVCRALGVSDDDFTVGLRTYPGLAHRQYLVRQMGDVLYVNDSKATNAEAASKALASYDHIYWIVGGRAKEGGLKGLESYMNHVKNAYLIGESADNFSAWLHNQNVSYTLSYDLEAAVQQAHYDAQSAGGHAVVLLSPACASFDQFESFEARGDMFVDVVQGL